MTKDEPAFPIQGAIAGFQYAGLSKRELFAAMAMQGFISGLYAGTNAGFTVEGTCFASVEYADALIAELSKEKV